MEEPDVRLGLGAAAAVAVGAAAAAGKNAAGDDTEDDSDDRVRMDVGVSFEATPTYTGTVGTEPRDREAGAYGGGTDGTDVYNDRSGDVADPPTTAPVSRLTRIEPDRQARIGGSGRWRYRVLAEAVVL